MPQCEITGKRARVGNSVSHANNRRKRLFRANIQRVKIVDANGTVRYADVSTQAIKSNKIQKAAPRRVILEAMKADQAAKPAKKAAKKPAAAKAPKAPAAEKKAKAPAAAKKEPAAKKPAAKKPAAKKKAE